MNLLMSGNVLTFAKIEPPSVSLKGFAGDTIQEKVRITPKADYPFDILSSRARSGKNIRYQIQKKNGWNNTEYLVTIENIKKNKGGYGDTIILRTDSDIKPEITISVFGRILVKQ